MSKAWLMGYRVYGSRRRRMSTSRGGRRGGEQWEEAACAALTELFAPEIHKQRLANWPEHYPWIDRAGLHYFQSRVSLARRDVEFGLAVTLDWFSTRAAQERALEILQFKLDVLWQMNDAMQQRYGVNS